MKPRFLDKLIERLDKLDPENLQTQFLRLTREKGLLEAIFNALHEGIIVLDEKGRITYANNSAADMLGFSIESVIQQPITRYLKDIKWNQILNLDEREWSKLISREIEITYPEHRFLNFYVMPVSLQDNDKKGAVVIFRDITGDREKEMSILKSERMNALTLLAAGVAHEIGNPLNSLHIHLQLMARELRQLNKKDRKNFQDLVKVSRNEVERLNLIITQFLRAIRPTSPKLQSSQIENVLKETLDFMKQDIRNRDILVDLKCTEPVPKISIDRNQIKQAVFNIIKNALQSMSKGGLLTISVFNNDRYVGVLFKDTGAGIPTEELGQIFEPYQTTKSNGTGLGLMIVQRIVQDHGGEIEIHSQPNVGTNFTIFLPLDQRRIRLLKAHRKMDLSKIRREKKENK